MIIITIIITAYACQRATGVQALGHPGADVTSSKTLDLNESLRGSCVRIGRMLRRLAWPLRKDDTQTSRSVNFDTVLFSKRS